mgnify:CR=1 FL=1
MVTFTSSRPLAPATRRTLAELVAATDALGISPCLIGAQARIIWLEHINSLPSARATEDTDFVIQIDTWDAFRQLGDALVRDHGWRRDARQTQRFYSSLDQMVDIVPCGGVAVDDAIHWPPDQSHRMDVRGLDIALREAVEIEVSQDLTIRVAPLPVLALLKLVSWRDRSVGREKDAEDLVSILKVYVETDEASALLEQALHLSLYELEDSDEARGARLLGRQVGAVAAGSTLGLVQEILAMELDPDGQLQLVLFGARALRGDNADDRALALLDAFRRGVDEGC